MNGDAALHQNYSTPIAAYQVSGEFAMMHAEADLDWLQLEAVALESPLSIKRAGASVIVSYFAEDAVAWIR